jgi:hypothetical protein
MQTQLFASQNELANVQTEIEQLRAVSGRLEQSLTQQNEAAARAAASTQAFAAWKKRIRGRITATDYRWSDDSPFVRIPKSALPELSKLSTVEPFEKPGGVVPFARELLSLTPAELQSMEDTLHRHFAYVDERLAAGIQETNGPLSGRVVAKRMFALPEPGDEAKQRTDQMLAEIRGILGDERWPLVQARLDDDNGKTHLSLDLESILNQRKQNLSVWVETDDQGKLTMGYNLGGAMATFGSGALSMFLPEGDPNRTDGAEKTIFGMDYLSKPLRARALEWLQEQAIARLGKGATR